MHTVDDGFRAFGLLIDVNWERLVYPLAVLGGLMLGAYLGMTLSHF